MQINQMIVKWLAVGIILLFLGTCIISAIAQDAERPLLVSRGKWLYVGGSGPGNYTRIQDAIYNASDGDTVFVYDDSAPYYEAVWIEKSISIIGENKNTTSIIWRGGGYALTIHNTEYVLVSGLKFNNSSNGVQVFESNNSVISGNIIEDNFFNLYMGHSNNITIKNNIIHHGTGEGILFFPSCTHNQIIDNIFDQNPNGAIDFLEYNKYNIIKNNTFIRNSLNSIGLSDGENFNLIQGNKIYETAGNGIIIWSSFNNTVRDNFVTNGTSDGIVLYDSYNNTVLNNSIYNDTHEGISLHGELAINNLLKNNIIVNNQRYGVYLKWADNNIIQDNIIKNSPEGIEIFSMFTGSDHESNNNTIVGNVIENNTIGVFLNGYGYNIRTPVRFNTIRNNVFSKNDFGIKSEYSWDNMIYHNNFYNNTVNANDDKTNIWYYGLVNEGNYWDNFDEPDEGAYDNDGNGIIDQPYQIPGGDSQDLYPLKNPYMNQPPKNPNVPYGNTTGMAGVSYTYQSNTTDPEEDAIFYKFDWDDFTESSWIGPFPSGDCVNVSHTWREGEIYHIRVKAMDKHGEESDWSELLEIQLMGPDIKIIDVKGGLGVKVFIKNIGNADITQVNWTIQYMPSNSLRMLYPLEKYSNGIISLVRTGETVIIKTYIFGLGSSQCYISIELERVIKVFYVVGPLVLIKKNPHTFFFRQNRLFDVEILHSLLLKNSLVQESYDFGA